MILQHFLDRLNAFSAFGPTPAGRVNVLVVPACIGGDGILEAAVGKRVADTDIHDESLYRTLHSLVAINSQSRFVHNRHVTRIILRGGFP
jgi:hypothetical protein